jgi:hypothetical protein
MAGKKCHEKQGYWKEMLDRQAGSGLSIRRFCAEERVSEPSFYQWRKKLRESAKGHRRPPMPGRSRGGDNGPLFMPVKLLDSAPALEIVHPLGYRIHVTGEVNPVTLRHVIEALDERGAP